MKDLLIVIVFFVVSVFLLFRSVMSLKRGWFTQGTEKKIERNKNPYWFWGFVLFDIFWSFGILIVVIYHFFVSKL